MDGNTSNNLTPIVVHSLTNLGGQLVINIANKVVCFGADDVKKFKA